ncbi:acyl-CoA thioesterase [Streptomyces sp. NPDC058683]|uniref:acyl-CoA thioesterase n=1 Tax=Streptomyces sp. NPDC058683 TaxID=3346597 RepID=UPI00364C6167
MFVTRIRVRGYETDALGHLNGSVYLQYAEHARWSLMQAAGVRQADLLENGVGPVNLETTVRYHGELRAGDDVDVSCELAWGAGKALWVHQKFHTVSGQLAAEVSSVGGLLDLTARRLVENPAEYFRKLAENPQILGL